MGDETALLLPFCDSGGDVDSSSSSMILGTGDDADEAPDEDAAGEEDAASNGSSANTR